MSTTRWSWASPTRSGASGLRPSSSRGRGRSPRSKTSRTTAASTSPATRSPASSTSSTSSNARPAARPTTPGPRRSPPHKESDHMHTRVCDMFGIDLPIFAFSHCRDVVAAVSKAGGLGVLGALAFSPEQLEIELNWLDEHCDGKPYGVDVVMPASYAGAGTLDPSTMADELDKMIDKEHRDFVENLLARFDVGPLDEDERGEGLLGWVHEKGRQQVEISLAHPIKLLVNALGPPPKDVVDLAHEHGVKVAALCGAVQ